MDNPGVDLNLNRQPFNQAVGSASRLEILRSEYNELGNVNDSIAERFRQLKAATVRAGLSHRWRRVRNLNETGGASTETMDDVNGGRGMHSGGIMERGVERGKGCKRESGRLVAMALEMDSEDKKVPEDGGSFYDCNICLYVAREPILTCCGHLFCWACFYKLPYVDSTAKECPVCEGEVTDSNIVPIYGNGDSIRESKLESGMTIPPRPKAQRVESVRQQRVARGVSNIPVAEALRRIRTGISAMRDHPQQEESSSSTLNFGNNSPESMRDEVQMRRLLSQQFSRVLSESAASISARLFALSYGERSIEDLETYINDSQLQRSNAQAIATDFGDSLTRNVVVSQLGHQISNEDIRSAVPGPSSSGTTALFNGFEQTENLATSLPTEFNLPPHRFFSTSRRRNSSSRDSD